MEEKYDNCCLNEEFFKQVESSLEDLIKDDDEPSHYGDGDSLEVDENCKSSRTPKDKNKAYSPNPTLPNSRSLENDSGVKGSSEVGSDSECDNISEFQSISGVEQISEIWEGSEIGEYSDIDSIPELNSSFESTEACPQTNKRARDVVRNLNNDYSRKTLRNDAMNNVTTGFNEPKTSSSQDLVGFSIFTNIKLSPLLTDQPLATPPTPTCCDLIENIGLIYCVKCWKRWPIKLSWTSQHRTKYRLENCLNTISS